jgi:hypothetical protein
MRRALGLDGDMQRQGPAREPEAQAARPRQAEQVPSDRRKRRFVQDGEVPVIMVQGRRDHAGEAASPLGNRLEHAESAANAERTTRLRAERSLQEALALVRDLQTKQAHAELASTEALEAARANAAEAESLRAALRDHEERLSAAEAAKAAATEQLATAEAALATERMARNAAERALRDTAGRVPAEQQGPAEPVTPQPSRRRARGSAGKAGDTAAAKKRPSAAKTAAAADPAPRPREPKPIKWWVKPAPKAKQRRNAAAKETRPPGLTQG